MPAPRTVARDVQPLMSRRPQQKIEALIDYEHYQALRRVVFERNSTISSLMRDLVEQALRREGAIK